jgi:hypothetical protein
MQFHEQRPSIKSVKTDSNKKIDLPKYTRTDKSPTKFEIEETKGQEIAHPL